jgi:hypothetical protein
MAKNSKPILSVLIDEDKRTKFADLARRHSLSMGYLVNKAVDRMLELDSIDIYGESTRSPQLPSINTSSIDIADVENLINTSIANLDLKSLIAAQLPPTETPPDDSLRGEVEALGELVTELQDYTQSQFKAVRDELKKPSAIAR